MDQSPHTAPATGHLRTAVLMGLFVGTAVGLGLLLAGVPNVELMSLMAALAGAAMGPRLGSACGALSAALYSLASPYGVPVVWILAAQMAGLAGMGILGGLWGMVMARGTEGPWRARAGALLVALVGTLWFEGVTTGAVLVGFDFSPRVVITGAIPFAMIHVGANLIVFGLLFPPLARRVLDLRRPTLSGRYAALAAAVLLTGCALWPGSPRAEVPATEAAATDAAAMVDSTTARPPAPASGSEAVASSLGWRRGLWHPFSQSLLDWLRWHGDVVALQDGGLGAVAMILGEPSTSPGPEILRDGLPLGTGHVLADDYGLVPIAGMDVTGVTPGLGPWGGSGGVISLRRRDRDPRVAHSSYEGAKGRHESYGRNVQVLTQQAPWRVGFEFQENLDKEGYNFTDLPQEQFDPEVDTYFPGHAKLRQSHARLSRILGPGARLDVDYDYGRKTKDLLPALAEDHQEIWAQGASVDMHARGERLALRTAVLWRNRDVRFDHAVTSFDTTYRLLSTGRQALLLEVGLLPGHGRDGDAPSSGPAPSGWDSLAVAPDSLATVLTDTNAAGLAVADTAMAAASGKPGRPSFAQPPTRLSLWVNNWTLDDTGPDSAWAGDLAGPVAMDGQDARINLVTGHRVGDLTFTLGGGAVWNNRAGWASEGSVGLSGTVPVDWSLAWEQGGRAPRSDEVGTVLRHGVADRVLVIAPDPDLGREKTRRLSARLRGGLLGIDLALTGVAGRLEDGITWRVDPGDPDRGRLVNAAAMDYTSLTAAVTKQGRFVGWGRIRYEGTWQDFNLDGQPPAFLPPERFSRLTVMWENHLFQEDGVVEVALFRTHVGAMADPWDVSGASRLPSRDLTDLVVGFRLVGADISLALRNLTGQRYRMSSGAWAPGRETVMRLAWRFNH